MKNYQVVIGSPIAYQFVTADVVINGHYIARVQKEEGETKLIVEFFENIDSTKVYLADFLDALQEATLLLRK